MPDEKKFSKTSDKRLDLLLSIAKNKHNNRRQEIEGQSKKAELLFIAVGFTFAGVTSLYQVNILNKDNIQQIIFLIFIFMLILLLVVLSWLWKRMEYDSPAISGMIDLYNDNINENDMLVEIINSYKQAEEFNRGRLKKIATRMNWAFVIMILVYLCITFFILMPNFKICIIN